LKEIWDNPTIGPKTYAYDVNNQMVNFGSPVIGDALGTDNWSKTTKISNFKSWLNNDLLLGT